ncbi:MAG: hypothetical protein GX547_13330 [Phycisphaerae bacterium]|nr:hypothetical protein [Phycisphaerae bacterium]
MTRFVALLLPGVVALSGCASQMAVTNQQSRLIQECQPEQVMTVAARMLQREFGRVHVNCEALTIETEPAEFVTTSDSGTARDLYRGTSTMRRVAHFSLARSGSGTLARLRINVERRDTERVANALMPTQTLGDLPTVSATPIQREAATTERQNTVWTFVRRDRQMERCLLDELASEFAPSAVEPPAAEAPGS